jgi:hypothetical protein
MTTGKRSASRTPSALDLRRARRRTIADVIAPRLRVLFGGINPGVYSAAIGHHFGRPGRVLEGAARGGVHAPAPIAVRGRHAPRSWPRDHEPVPEDDRECRRAHAGRARARRTYPDRPGARTSSGVRCDVLVYGLEVWRSRFISPRSPSIRRTGGYEEEHLHFAETDRIPVPQFPRRTTTPSRSPPVCRDTHIIPHLTSRLQGRICTTTQVPRSSLGAHPAAGRAAVFIFTSSSCHPPGETPCSLPTRCSTCIVAVASSRARDSMPPCWPCSWSWNG